MTHKSSKRGSRRRVRYSVLWHLLERLYTGAPCLFRQGDAGRCHSIINTCSLCGVRRSGISYPMMCMRFFWFPYFFFPTYRCIKYQLRHRVSKRLWEKKKNNKEWRACYTNQCVFVLTNADNKNNEVDCWLHWLNVYRTVAVDAKPQNKGKKKSFLFALSSFIAELASDMHN